MKKDELLRLIKIGESDYLEFKESFDKESVQTAGAFANKRGGTILIGVTDRGELKGVQTGRGTVEGWINQISQSTDPRVVPETESFLFDGKHVFAIKIKEFPLKPVSVKGKCFKRVNKSNRVMTTHEIAAMHYNSIDMSWDKLPAKNVTMEDIDPEKIRKFINKAKRMGRREISES